MWPSEAHKGLVAGDRSHCTPYSLSAIQIKKKSTLPLLLTHPYPF